MDLQNHVVLSPGRIRILLERRTGLNCPDASHELQGANSILTRRAAATGGYIGKTLP
jgi:hypothetical protein